VVSRAETRDGGGDGLSNAPGNVQAQNSHGSEKQHAHGSFEQHIGRGDRLVVLNRGLSHLTCNGRSVDGGVAHEVCLLVAPNVPSNKRVCGELFRHLKWKQSTEDGSLFV